MACRWRKLLLGKLLPRKENPMFPWRGKLGVWGLPVPSDVMGQCMKEDSRRVALSGWQAKEGSTVCISDVFECLYNWTIKWSKGKVFLARDEWK